MNENVEGRSVYLNDFRIAGNKPWGGGRVENTFRVKIDDLARALHIDDEKLESLISENQQPQGEEA